MPPLLKLALDLGPLLIFFGVNWLYGIFAATAVFMVVIVVTLGITYSIEKKLSPMPIVTAVVVLVFGGLTLYLEDELFIKLKPTIVNGIFATVLFAGLAFGRPFIKIVLEHAMQLTDEGWRLLTYRWAFFFLFLAILNELVWRNTSTDFWVAFKVWGVFPLTLVFAVAQAPFIMRHQIEEPGAKEGSARS
ncbi:MAG: septation protein A [Alphaproteobacteria bacterium]|nr:septation protein A [Alphaproteobacteria bacterium]